MMFSVFSILVYEPVNHVCALSKKTYCDVVNNKHGESDVKLIIFAGGNFYLFISLFCLKLKDWDICYLTFLF